MDAFTRRSLLPALLTAFATLILVPKPSLASSAASPAIIKLKVVAEQANIRLKPDITSIIIRQVPKGTILESLEKRGEWYSVQVSLPDEQPLAGFVHESLVEPLEPPPVPEKPPAKEPETVPPKKPPVSPPPAQPQRAYTPGLRLDVFLAGGGAYTWGGDLNTGAQGLADYYADVLGVEEGGDIKPARLSPIFGGDVFFPLAPALSWGVGADYFKASRETRVAFQTGEGVQSLTARPEFRAVPLRLSLRIMPVRSFYIRAGLAVYLARCAYSYRIEGAKAFQQWEGKASALGLGFTGGVGLAQDLLSRLSLVLEIGGRYARISGFSGTDTFSDSEGAYVTEEGKLYAYRVQTSQERFYQLVFIRSTAPREAGVVEARQARLDLSGVTVRVGFHIRL
ncbi:MAG: hypothetical protein ACE5LV_00100 [Candidatus Aminicenantales bacterium]